MERRLYTGKIKFILLSLILYAQSVYNPVFAQHEDFTERIHLPLWAEIDAYPELEQAQNPEAGPFDFSVERIREVGPYLLNGMVYGWNFSYTPSDKVRGVQEFFEVTPINTIKDSDGPITYAKPWIEDNLLHVWVEYTRTPQQIWNLKAWRSITSQKTQGRGYGSIKKGFKGIEEASEQSIKEGIRSHYRAILKNKPKRIDGRIIIRSSPRLGLKSGQYIVELDFFLKTDRIVKYSQF